MCGIAGYISPYQNLEAPHTVQKILDILQHRGPDGEGLVCLAKNGTVQNTPLANEPSIILGHRRLAIIDLSAMGHQPMCSADGTVWISFNGEIYNYIELREELRIAGYSFRTATDTEVLIAAYQIWGKNCLERLNGMFAFVLYDVRQALIWGVRDRIGVKPLYYYSDSEHFIFASEIKALCALPIVQRKINDIAIFDYFLNNSIEEGEQTLFKNIHSLLPAHYFLIDLRHFKLSFHRYFDKKTVLSSVKSANIQDLEYAVTESVRLRLRSDVPVGTCLSGGIDSSILAGLMRQLAPHQELKAFTACFEDKQYDEQVFAQEVVRMHQINWVRSFPDTKGFWENFETLIYAQDVPMASTSSYAQFCVMKAAKEHGIKVLLDGQGADELLGGYYHYYVAYWNELVLSFRWLKLMQEWKTQTTPIFKTLKKYFQFLLKHSFFKYLPARWQWFLQRKNINDWKYLNIDFFSPHLKRLEEHIQYKMSSLENALTNDYFEGSLRHLLKCEDRSSMWFSIESRTPFADDTPLMKTVFALPAHLKIQNSVRKYALREAFKPILPVSIYERKDKMGFVSPNNHWLSENKKNFLPYFERQDNSIFQTAKIIQDMDKILHFEQKEENYRTFKLMGLAVWRKVFDI